MDQYRAVAKVLKDLIQFGLIKEDDRGQVRLHLDRLYTAGWEEKNKAWADKRSISVIQCDKKGKPIQEFHNVLIAARKAKYSRVTIYTSLKTGKPTQRGHIWKYKEEEA
jgi:hypothetical protein